MVVYQTEYPKLEQSSLKNFLVAEKSKSPEIYRRMRDAYKEAILDLKKMLTNRQNMSLSIGA